MQFEWFAIVKNVFTNGGNLCLKVNGDRVAIEFVDAADKIVASATDDEVARIEHLPPRIDDVGRIERCSILPAYAPP